MRYLWSGSWSVALMALTMGCGATSAASPGPTASPDPSTERTAAAENEPVLLLGRALAAMRFEVLADGTLRSDNGRDVYGRLETDGTLRRADGSICARVARDGAITIELPSRVRGDDFAGLRIEGNTLFMSDHRGPHAVMTIEGADLVSEGRHHAVDGLTPEYQRTMLAAHALFFMVVLIESEMTMF